MKAHALVRLKFPSEKHLEIVFKALEPEARTPPTMRSQAKLEKENTFLILKIEAKDTVALRAAVNAYLRWINSMVSVLEVVESIP
ncbi:MAG: KEOPS complex subunit Pcc1 [Candidatus Bathyarchaeota archaeon]|nr:KEOPS complex subunit Pcc1 [Candidatus Bathyarchaeota archaeon]MDH5745684.1 KEOPS complex subunit Pcc1 [Candidatus Bathyarchaeota archaeon]